VNSRSLIRRHSRALRSSLRPTVYLLAKLETADRLPSSDLTKNYQFKLLNLDLHSAHQCNSSYGFLVTGSIARSATRRYLSYSEADFEVFRPAGATRCTDVGKIWHGGPSSVPNFTPSVQQ